jgi:flagellar motility protein MotE (MotC chaperone)
MAGSKGRSIVSGLFSLAGVLAIVMLLLSGAGIPAASAQEKKADKKAPAKQETKTGKTAASPASIEEERLKILNADLLARIDQLKKLKTEIEESTKALDTKKKEQLGKVVKMYESMPSEEAAKAIGRLDDDTAVQILTSLKARSAGQILGQMDPDRVAALSKKAIFRSKLSKEKSSP